MSRGGGQSPESLPYIGANVVAPMRFVSQMTLPPASPRFAQPVARPSPRARYGVSCKMRAWGEEEQSGSEMEEEVGGKLSKPFAALALGEETGRKLHPGCELQDVADSHTHGEVAKHGLIVG